MIDYIFPFYMLLSCFIAGMYYQKFIIDSEPSKQDFIVLFIAIFFGTLIAIYVVLEKAYKWFNGFLNKK